MADTVAMTKLKQARLDFLLNRSQASMGFFGRLGLRLKLVEQPLPDMPTMATDGRCIYFDPGFVSKCSDEELVGVFAHEVMHCALRFFARVHGRDLLLFNVAQDYLINDVLTKGGLKLPAGTLLSDKYTWDKWSTEEVYNDLLKNHTKVVQFNGMDGDGKPFKGEGMVVKLPGWGQAMPGKEEAAGETGVLEKEWAVAFGEELKRAKQQGTLPGSMERFLSDLGEGTVNWHECIKRMYSWAADLVSFDLTFARPNRRYVWQDQYFPSTVKEGFGPIAVIVDVSGSVDARLLQAFGDELNGMKEMIKPSSLHVLYVDTQVQHTDHFGPEDKVVVSTKGGGGTDFKPGFKWLEENKVVPDCCIYLTDMYCDSFPEKPEYPVLWVTDNKGAEAPFGEMIRTEFRV